MAEPARDHAQPGRPTDRRASETRELASPAVRGQTYVEDDVVSIVARTAAERVEGVHRLGDSSLRTLFSRFGRSHGVEAEVGMKEAAIDVDVIVEFGYPIRDVAQQIRQRVIEVVEDMVGRTVLEVNVYVIDIHTPAVESRRRRTLE